MPTNKGKIIAAGALLSWIGISLGSGSTVSSRLYAHLSPPQIFLFGAVLSLAGTVYCVWLMPDSLLRFLLWCATHSLYRIRVLGRDNIPEKGGALFVCNHVSFVDAVLLLASTDRQVRIMMYKGIYERPYLKPLAKILGVIPISSEQRPREMIKSLQTASDAIRAGEVVCIFAEGQITRIGHLLPFRRGFERIMKDVDAPIIPIGVDGVWGSIFSFAKGRFLWKLPRRFPYPVTINYGKPLPPTATPFQVRSTVQELLAEAWQSRKARMRPLPIAFVNTARNHPVPFCDGRCAKCPRHLRRGAGAIRFSGAAIAENLVGSKNGRALAAAVGAGRAGQSRRLAARQSAGESELHRVAGNPRLLHSAVRSQNHRHLESVSRQGKAQTALRNDFSGRPCRCFGSEFRL